MLQPPSSKIRPDLIGLCPLAAYMTPGEQRPDGSHEGVPSTLQRLYNGLKLGPPGTGRLMRRRSAALIWSRRAVD